MGVSERGRVLADGEDEGIVDGETGALGLSNVQIVALGMWGGMDRDELVGWVLAYVGEGKGEGEGMRVRFDGVHQSPLATVYPQCSMAFITRQNCLDGVPLTPTDPFRLA